MNLTVPFGMPYESPTHRPASELTATEVADELGNAHTSTMTLKKAALLSLIGTTLTTVLLAWVFVSNVLNAMRGLVPGVSLFSSFIYAFGCFSGAVFFYVFHRGQS